MPRIRILDDRLVSQIAAGEVVERPASVVKELLENSLDAGASEIRIELETGGKRRITIADDGCGMGSDDALLAFDRHATSKLEHFEDLERVGTLGFRGEALASIAAVARVELRTAAVPGDGIRVRIEGGRVKAAEPISHPRGARIEVASLFFNVPARRKFLKKPQTELRRAIEVVQGYALAYPRLRLEVRHDGRTLLEALPVPEGPAGLRERIGQIFGASLVRNLQALPEPPVVWPGERIYGFVGNRETARGRRLFVYVNGRLVRDRAIVASFYRAVRHAWKGDDIPALFLFLALPPEEVDVNVHPTKAEVRFRDPAFPQRVESTLEMALGEARAEAPAPLRTPRAMPQVPLAWQGLGGKPRDEEHGTWRPLPPPPSAATPPPPSPAGPPAPSGPAAAPAAAAETYPLPQPPAAGAEHHDTASNGQGEADEVAEPPTPAYDASARQIAEPTYVLPPPRSVPLSGGRAGAGRSFRLLGQYKGSLILLEGPDGLYLIDQHAAHERILYERLRRAFEAERPPSQTLLEPLLLDLAPAEAMRLREAATKLDAFGFQVAPLSGHTVAVTAVPSALSIEQAEKLLHELATARRAVATDTEALRRQLLETLAADRACKGAIKIHHPLGGDKMEALISELFAAEQPYSCPHGRPTILQMTDAELERKFGRR